MTRARHHFGVFDLHFKHQVEGFHESHGPQASKATLFIQICY